MCLPAQINVMLFTVLIFFLLPKITMLSADAITAAYTSAQSYTSAQTCTLWTDVYKMLYVMFTAKTSGCRRQQPLLLFSSHYYLDTFINKQLVPSILTTRLKSCLHFNIKEVLLRNASKEVLQISAVHRKSPSDVTPWSLCQGTHMIFFPL